MSDALRQNFTDKAESALKPDSQKSGLEQFGDEAKGKLDSFGSSAQPNSEKSFAQQAGDAISGNSNENSDSLLSKAQNALGGNSQ